ncbi:DMT family transporter [Halosolutus gelatinilyticus]|uniref:DMT family transporter n=1 Tax=Halosolutus gelatinilyticus TaxID=2931975 RepID=UPI001FF1711E|nr:EamA family transporter [Halosolutus gelatinilyticus]
MTGKRDLSLFVALAIVWGTAFGAIEVGLATLPPILFAALRLDVATLLFTAGIAVYGLEWRPRTRDDWIAIGVGGVLLVGGHYGLLFLGQSHVSSAVAAIVLSLTPVVTPPLAIAVLPQERLRAPAAVGLLLGLAGVIVVALSGGSLGGQAVGVVLLFAAAFVFALGSVLIERAEETLPVVPLQTWAMGVGALALHGLSYVHPGESVPAASAWTSTTIAALAYLGVVATAGGFLAYFVLLDRIGASQLSLVSYASPVVAALVGWALLGETITLATIGGFGLIVLGFALCKIGALWKTAGPVVGYGPHRPTGAIADDDPDRWVVDRNGNAYVAASGRGAEGRTSAPGAD